jgi:hypothetical protein
MDQLLWSASTAVLQGARRFAAALSGPPAAELRASGGAEAVRGGRVVDADEDAIEATERSRSSSSNVNNSRARAEAKRDAEKQRLAELAERAAAARGLEARVASEAPRGLADAQRNVERETGQLPPEKRYKAARDRALMHAQASARAAELDDAAGSAAARSRPLVLDGAVEHELARALERAANDVVRQRGPRHCLEFLAAADRSTAQSLASSQAMPGSLHLRAQYVSSSDVEAVQRVVERMAYQNGSKNEPQVRSRSWQCGVLVLECVARASSDEIARLRLGSPGRTRYMLWRIGYLSACGPIIVCVRKLQVGEPREALLRLHLGAGAVDELLRASADVAESKEYIFIALCVPGERGGRALSYEAELGGAAVAASGRSGAGAGAGAGACAGASAPPTSATAAAARAAVQSRVPRRHGRGRRGGRERGGRGRRRCKRSVQRRQERVLTTATPTTATPTAAGGGALVAGAVHQLQRRVDERREHVRSHEPTDGAGTAAAAGDGGQCHGEVRWHTGQPVSVGE